jgi:hypothetical protein
MTRRSLLLLSLLLALLIVIDVQFSLARSAVASSFWSRLLAPLPASVASSASGSSVVSPSASRVIGRPSLSAAFIDRVLAAYRSPAVGLGQALYADSLRFGIDDVYALAFFWHESTFGRYGVAAVTHSLGNIICTPGFSSCVGRFRAYPRWQAGAWDWFHLLASEYLPRGLTTVEQIVPVYAPAGENDVSAYIRAVEAAVSCWRVGRLEVRL